MPEVMIPHAKTALTSHEQQVSEPVIRYSTVYCYATQLLYTTHQRLPINWDV